MNQINTPTLMTLLAVPKDVVCHRIIPKLARDLNMFSIVSLGTASRALNAACEGLLKILNGLEPGKVHADLQAYADLRLKLRVARRCTDGQRALHDGQRALQMVLRQAWNNPTPSHLLALMSRADDTPTQVLELCSRHFNDEPGLRVMFRELVQAAMENPGRGEFSQAQAKMLGEISCLTFAEHEWKNEVIGYLDRFEISRRPELLRRLCSTDFVLRVNDERLMRRTAADWLAQVWPDLIEQTSKLDKHFFGNSRLGIDLIGFICTQLARQPDLKEKYLDQTREALKSGDWRYVKQEELEELIEFFQACRGSTVDTWLLSVISVRKWLNSSVAQPVTRTINLYATLEMHARNLDLLVLQPTENGQAGNVRKKKKKRRLKCSQM